MEEKKRRKQRKKRLKKAQKMMKNLVAELETKLSIAKENEDGLYEENIAIIKNLEAKLTDLCKCSEEDESCMACELYNEIYNEYGEIKREFSMKEE